MISATRVLSAKAANLSAPKARQTERLATIALLAGALALTAMPANAALKTCYGPMEGVGRDRVPAIAFSKAKTSWRIHVEDAYGMFFADWANAEDHDRTCTISGHLTYCTVHARPCTGSDYGEGVNKNPVYD